MRDNKRGTIEDRSTSRLLAFEQKKHERLLGEKLTPWPTPGTVEDAEFGEAEPTSFNLHESIGRVLEDTEHTDTALLKVCIAALSAGITARILRTPEDCLGVLLRVQMNLNG